MLQAETISTADGWSVFRGNPQHTGKTSLIGPPEEYELKWRWRMQYDSSPISASPVLSSNNILYCATEGGYLGALDIGGSSSWVYPVEGAVRATPALDGTGNVCVITSSGYVYFLNNRGELQWKCDLGIGIVSSPVIDGTTAYVGTNSNGLFALTLNPDLSRYQDDTKRLLKWDILRWSFLTEGEVVSSPAFAGNTVFFGGGSKFYALNPLAGSSDNTTAKVKWTYDLHSAIQSSPAVYNGVVYIGDDDGYVYAFKETVENSKKLGEIIWKRKTGGPVRCSPAINIPAAGETGTEAVIYIGSDDGKMYALSQKGDLLWTFSTLGPVRSSPIIDGNGDIYFGSDDGSVYALFSDGSLKWRYQTGGKVRSSPVIGTDKKLYIGSDDGFLYCIGENTTENREYDFSIDVSLSLPSIENNGNPTTIAAKISSETEGKNILSRIASVTLDLTGLNLIGVLSASDPLSGDIQIGSVGVEQMVDDGLYEDDVAGDGIFTYAFGLTDDPALIGWDEGIYTHFPALGPLAVGPVPLMVTVTDLYGNKKSRPFILKIDQKMRGVPPFNDSITNLLNNQSLTISFTSGTPSILSVVPSKGAPGQRVNVTILGKNTNFTKNRTRVQIFNSAGIAIASALPENDDVDVLSDTSLNAVLSITNNEQIKGGLVGRWDVTVTTEFAEGGDEVVVGKSLFEIGTVAASMKPAFVQIRPLTSGIASEQTFCQFTLDITDSFGARPKGAPYSINVGYPRTITIERARSGLWNYSVNIGECSTTPSFKIITTADNFGFLSGEVRDGITGNGIDNATITAMTGEQTGTPVGTAVSSGGGYYLLPLAASEKTYTVIARKNGMVDLRRNVVIKNGEETKLNFSLRLEVDCPLTDLAEPGWLPPLYRYRDTVLGKTAEGRHMISLYYRYAPKVRQILDKSPELRSRLRKLIESTACELSFETSSTMFKPETIREFLDVLKEIERYADEDFKMCIANEWSAIMQYIKSLKSSANMSIFFTEHICKRRVPSQRRIHDN